MTNISPDYAGCTSNIQTQQLNMILLDWVMIYGSMEREISGFTKIKDTIKGRKGGVYGGIKVILMCVFREKKICIDPSKPHRGGDDQKKKKKCRWQNFKSLSFPLSFFFFSFPCFPPSSQYQGGRSTLELWKCPQVGTLRGCNTYL